MHIIRALPPNFEAIDAVFQLRRKFNLFTRKILFCYGDAIYNPSGWDFETQFLKHEEVHARQQAPMGPEAWWDRYLVDRQFRLEQEIEASRVQYQTIIDSGMGRPQRRREVAMMAEFLAGPVYGYMISKDQAKREIKKGMDDAG